MKFLFLFTLLLLPGINDSLYAQTVRIIAENSKNNRLYAGIDNPLKIEIAEQKSDSIGLKTNNGKILCNTDSFIAIPKRSGRARIQLYLYSLTDTSLLYSTSFLVNSVPMAQLKLGENLLNDMNSIRKEELIGEGAFDIYFNEDIVNCDNWFTIHDITFGYTIGGFFHRHVNRGSKFSDETIEVIKKTHPGSEITFKVRLEGQGNVLKTLPLYTSRVY